MLKVELNLEEYNDLLESRNNALSDKIKLKKRIIELQQKNTELLAKYLMKSVYVWTHAFKKEEEINEFNLEKYVCASLMNSNEFTKDEILEAVRWLYNEKINE